MQKVGGQVTDTAKSIGIFAVDMVEETKTPEVTGK